MARAVGVVLLVLTMAVADLLPSTSAAVASGGAEPAALPPVGGFGPTWARDLGGRDLYDLAVAFDRFGGTYQSTGRTVVRQLDPQGQPVRALEADGTGSLQSAGIVVSDDLEVTVLGYVSGTVTVGVPPNQATLTEVAGAEETIYLLHLDATGRVTWGRTYGVPWFVLTGLDQAGDHVVARAVHDAPLDLDGHELDPGSSAVNAALVGFSLDDGGVDWLTGVDVTGANASDGSVWPRDASATSTSYALSGGSIGSFEVRSDGASFAVDCEDVALTSIGCPFLAVIDPATGVPTLAKRLDPPVFTDPVVASADDGYVIGHDTFTQGNGTGSHIQWLDANADVVQSFDVAGPSTSLADLTVDSRGDVVAALTMNGPTTLGTGPGAPVVTPTGTRDLLLVELDASGALRRWTTAGGPGSSIDLDTYAVPRLGTTGDDRVLVAAGRTGAVTVGGGAGAVTVPGAGLFVASFPPDRPADDGSTFHPTPPTRLLDSRTATGGWNAKLAAGQPRSLAVAGVAGVPANATAVVLNLTTTNVSDMTYLVAWPTGAPRPTASNLNVVAGDTIANHATVAVGDGGTITLANAVGTAHVVADLYGYYTPDATGDRFHPITPTRLLDSRTATGGWNHTLDAGSPRALTVTGGAIPVDASGVVLSVTATNTTAATYLRVEPTGATTGSSNLNVDAGQTITNLVTTPIGTSGRVTFTNNTGSAHVVADAVGYYRHDATGSTFHPIAPIRALDSRTGTGGSTTPWSAGTTRAVDLAGIVPTNVATTAVAANLTATDTTAMSYATLFPAAPRPGTSSLLFAGGQTIAAAATTGVAADGTVSLYNQLGSANLILDLDGYFTTA